MKKSKWLIMMMVVCFLISMVPLKELKVLAVGSADTYSKMRVRVEGVNGTLFNQEVGKDVIATTSLDLLKAAVGADKVEGSDGSYGFFITGILGEKQANNNSWGFYAQNPTVLETNTAVDKLNVKDLNGNFIYNELVFYMSYYTTAASTKIPTITVKSTGDNHEIMVKDLWSSLPIPNIEVTVQNVKTLTTDANGKVNFQAAQGNYNISFGKRGTYIEVAPITYMVSLPVGDVSTGDNTNTGSVTEKKAAVKSTIDLNRNYYSKVQNLKFGAILSLYQVSDNKAMDMASITSKFKVSQLEKATSYAGNIFALTALNKNPKNNEGVDYVQKLIDAQRADGMFVVEDGDEMWPTTQAYNILALDMTGGNYKVSDAIKAIISMAKNGHYDDIDTTAMVTIALANHKDIPGVNELILSSFKYIKDSQLNSGGFEAFGAENPYTVATVMQAVVANGIDVYSNEWTKNGNTMVDSLLTYRFGDHFKYTASWGSDEVMVTDQAFAALADVYREKSIYQTLKLTSLNETSTNETSTNQTIQNQLPQTGSTIDFNILIALGFAFTCMGVYLVRRKVKKI